MTLIILCSFSFSHNIYELNIGYITIVIVFIIVNSQCRMIALFSLLLRPSLFESSTFVYALTHAHGRIHTYTPV